MRFPAANPAAAHRETDRLLSALEELIAAEDLALQAGDVTAASAVSARVFPVLKSLAHALDDYREGRLAFAERISKVQRARRANQALLEALRSQMQLAFDRNRGARRRLKDVQPAYAARRVRSTFAAAG